MNEWLNKYDSILNYLLEYRKTHPEFKFLTRMQNNQRRLDNGYWFQGTDEYIFVPLFNVGDRYNKTKTIGFVVTKYGQYIEIVIKKIVNETEGDYHFHDELVHYLKSLNIFKRIEEKHEEKQFYFWFKDNDLEKNLNFYINEFRKKALELLDQYGLTERYMITEESFQKNIKRIMEIKNSGTNVATAEVENDLIETETNMYIRNIILYGVPGVGKTHNISKLISLIEEGRRVSEIFDTIRKNEPHEKESLEDMQDRVEFVTFHQSFGYEDFIEGFRPNEEGNIELIDGIFKSLSLRAKENSIDSKKETKELTQESLLLEKFKSYVTYKLENDEPIRLKKGSEFRLIQFDNNRLIFSASENAISNKEFIIKLRDFMKIYKSDKEKRTLKDIADILGTSSIQQKYAYYLALYKDFKDFNSLNNHHHKSKTESIEEKNYYLIIDEINRGNISKIFGELITLIEEDKRDTYEVTLPYSKEKFSVPSNLYIIGTMNSTDKSIALIDIALRRRFTFLKMQPNDNLVPDFAKDLFVRLNEKIKEKLGDEYQIGHSYFMNIADGDALDFVLEYKIKPLLEEYFYGDEAGLKDVLSVIEERGE